MRGERRIAERRDAGGDEGGGTVRTSEEGRK